MFPTVTFALLGAVASAYFGGFLVIVFGLADTEQALFTHDGFPHLQYFVVYGVVYGAMTFNEFVIVLFSDLHGFIGFAV